jgi:hypothetical protein
MKLIPVLNKTSAQAHTNLELDLLGVLGKLVFTCLIEKKTKKYVFLHTSCPNYNRSVFGLKEF